MQPAVPLLFGGLMKQHKKFTFRNGVAQPMKRIQRAAAMCSVFTMMGALLLGVLLPVSQVSAQSGTDWVGQFYSTRDLTGAVVATASYATGLNFNWGTGQPTDGLGTPLAAVPADNFSARFVTQENLAAGLYEFIIVADDGVRLFIDGNLVVDSFTDKDTAGRSSTVVSLGGGVYTLIVDYFNGTGPAVLQVSWLLSTGTPQATTTAAPIAVGQVQSVRGLAIRTGPYLGASLVGVARPERDYPILERNESEGVFTWYRIQATENIVGWSSGRYMAPTGDLNQIPITSTIFDQIDNAPDRGVIGVTRSVMNMRVRPSVRTQRIAQIPWGGEVQILGRTIQGGRDFWYHVRYNGQVGWILAAYVGVRGNPIDAVPVY